jgi:hypothetical protein
MQIEENGVDRNAIIKKLMIYVRWELREREKGDATKIFNYFLPFKQCKSRFTVFNNENKIHEFFANAV